MAHWGNYEWSGGQETADVRAFWLFDRTGDPTMNSIIESVANEWNAARADHPELPFIAIYRDDANAGKCFVNRTPGYSVASACILPSLSAFGIKGISATQGSPHFTGGAFAISDGLSFEDAFTAVCHNFGHIMGLADSSNNQSCMSHNTAPGELKWYGQGDTDAILALYGHGDGETPTAVADTFTYMARSGGTDSSVTTVEIVVAPDADSDVEGDPLEAWGNSDPEFGSEIVNRDGSFIYTPNLDFVGTDTFTYLAGDGPTTSEPATVTITVTAADGR